MLSNTILTRNGQTTIPKQLREKYGFTEGTLLEVIDTGDGVLYRKAPTMKDLVGSGLGKLSYQEAVTQLDRMRREDV